MKYKIGINIGKEIPAGAEYLTQGGWKPYYGAGEYDKFCQKVGRGHINNVFSLHELRYPIPEEKPTITAEIRRHICDCLEISNGYKNFRERLVKRIKRLVDKELKK